MMKFGKRFFQGEFEERSEDDEEVTYKDLAAAE